jgi:hypothetical protein
VLLKSASDEQASEIESTSGEIMTTTSATPSWHSIGLYAQIAGAGAFIVGVVLSFHHYAIGICFIAGAAAFYVGKKLRAAY